MKTNKKPKTICIIVLVLLLVIGSIGVFQKYRYRQVKEVEINEVYMGYGIYGVPAHNENRYYIELRDNGTYSLLFDRTHDDGEGKSMMNFVVGEYEIEDNVYILSPKKGVMIQFGSSMDEILEIVTAEGDELFIDEHGWRAVSNRNVYKIGDKVILAVPKEDDPKEYYGDYSIEELYHADKNDLPDTVEEFLQPYEEQQKATETQQYRRTVENSDRRISMRKK